MEYLQLISVPVIGTVVYWMVNLIKYAVKSNETFMRFIPLIAAFLGATLGIICFYALPSVIAADNFLMALLIGGASGLSATGFNQVIKQLSKDKNKNDNVTNGISSQATDKVEDKSNEFTENENSKQGGHKQ